MKSIHIYENGPVVTAILKDGKQTIGKGEAKCAPTDAFNFEMGAKLALDRVFRDYDTRPFTVDELGDIGKCYPFSSFPRIVKQDRYEVGDRIVTKSGSREIVKGMFNPAYLCESEDDGECGSVYEDAISGKLFEDKPVRELHRPAKVGEWVRVTDAKTTFGDYKNGDVILAGRRYKDKGITAKDHCEDWGWIDDSEYVVLEGYQPEVSE